MLNLISIQLLSVEKSPIFHDILIIVALSFNSICLLQNKTLEN